MRWEEGSSGRFMLWAPHWPYRVVPLQYWQSDSWTSAASLLTLPATHEGFSHYQPLMKAAPTTSHSLSLLPLPAAGEGCSHYQPLIKFATTTSRWWRLLPLPVAHEGCSHYQPLMKAAPTTSRSWRESGQVTPPLLASSRTAWGTFNSLPPLSRRLGFLVMNEKKKKFGKFLMLVNMNLMWSHSDARD